MTTNKQDELRHKIESIEYKGSGMCGRAVRGGVVYDQISDNHAIKRRVENVQKLINSEVSAVLDEMENVGIYMGNCETEQLVVPLPALKALRERYR